MAVPATMTVVAIRAPGGPEMLVPEQRPVPQPGEGEVLIKVAAAGVNRPDVMQRQGLYPPPKGATDIPGLEIAGEVVAIGPGVTRWKAGDKVMALVVGGGYAQYCPAHESHCLPVPAGLPMVEAAAVPETFFTVWYNTFERGKLKAGETFLVHGGSSGIGTAAIQLAKLAGARVITTAGSAEKCAACQKLGADVAKYESSEYGMTQAIAAAAHFLQFDALIVPSARVTRQPTWCCSSARSRLRRSSRVRRWWIGASGGQGDDELKHDEIEFDQRDPSS